VTTSGRRSTSNSRCTRASPTFNLTDLQDAWRDMLKRATLVQHHTITREELSVREHMSMVLRKLQGRRFIEFEALFDPAKGGTPVLVVTFIALLELAKETLIEIVQAEAFAPIYVRLAYTPT
jgi:segregation and condensation protein A